MSNPMDRHRSLGDKLFTARRVFSKGPSVLHRLRLYLEFRRFSSKWLETEDFDLKIRDVCASPDNKQIPRVPNAGEFVDGYLIMHNGLPIIPHSYVGEGMTRLLNKNRGVHEP